MGLEKLNLSEKECLNVHVEKDESKCHNLKVYDKIITNTKQETYLRDIIHKTFLLRHTVDARIANGYGSINTILAIVNETPLGHWRIETGLGCF